MKKGKLNRRRFFTTAGLATAGLAASGRGCTTSPSILRKPETLERVDVLVVGGGPAGIGAALGAARKGVHTMIIENQSFFGGVAAWMMGMMINEIRPRGRPRSFVHEQLISKIAAYGDQAIRFGHHEIWCNVEYLKVGILDALEETACKYLVHAGAVDAVVQNNRITGVVIGTKGGLKEIRAKVVVDCTGDADVAYFAGAETMTDPDDVMPQTLGLLLSNVDEEKLPPNDMRKRIQGRIHDSLEEYPLNP